MSPGKKKNQIDILEIGVQNCHSHFVAYPYKNHMSESIYIVKTSIFRH